MAYTNKIEAKAKAISYFEKYGQTKRFKFIQILIYITDTEKLIKSELKIRKDLRNNDYLAAMFLRRFYYKQIVTQATK